MLASACAAAAFDSMSACAHPISQLKSKLWMALVELPLGRVLQGQAARSLNDGQQQDGACQPGRRFTCAVQQAGKLLDHICFWDDEAQPDAVCVDLLADAVRDPAAAALTTSASMALRSQCHDM